MRYRPDIDGMRAIAVAAVVLCHAGLPGFSGGYVGVDVFFVISGFLITSIIAASAERGDFSLAGFYRSRMKRIVPALVLVLACCAIVACFVMTPDDLTQFARSAMWSTLFAANIFFYFDIDYFGPAAASAPLLHLWSLGVEEQFYLLFPVAFGWLARRKGRALACISAMFALSLIASALAVSISERAAFYLPQFRAWELLLGSMVALAGRTAIASRTIRETAALAGLALIVIPVFLYVDETPFPGLAALPPCLGTAMLIVSGAHRNTWVSRILSTLPFIFVGWISYSLYLWHWPVLVFFRYFNLMPLDDAHTALALFVMLVLSVATWLLVERPARHTVMPLRSIGLATAAFSTLVLSTGGLIVWSKGWEGRFDAETRAYLAMLNKEAFFGIYDRRGCFIDYDQTVLDYDEAKCLPPAHTSGNVLIWGDSFAAHLYPGMRAALDGGVWQYTATSCRPVHMGDARCDSFNGALESKLAGRRFDLVVVAGYWGNFVDTVGRDVFATRLAETLARARLMADRVVIVGQTPVFDFPPPMIGFMYPSERARPEIVIEAHDDRQLNGFLRSIARDAEVEFFDPLQFACQGRICPAYFDGRPLHWDEGHLTKEGSVFYGSAIAKMLKQQVREAPAQD